MQDSNYRKQKAYRSTRFCVCSTMMLLTCDTDKSEKQTCILRNQANQNTTLSSFVSSTFCKVEDKKWVVTKNVTVCCKPGLNNPRRGRIS